MLAALPAPDARAESKTESKTAATTPSNPDNVGALTVFADGDESIGEIPLTVKLDVEVLEGTGVPPYRYLWDFGDGTTFSTEEKPTHVYRIPGSFRASVVVMDARNELDQDYVDISVREPLGKDEVSAREFRAWIQARGLPERASELPDASPERSPAASGEDSTSAAAD